VLASPPPPAISGGTLLVTGDGTHAVAADSDRDRVWIVDLEGLTPIGSVALQPGDEPGRTVEGAPGRAHVALRSGGAVVTIDVATATLVRRTPICPEPRGLAYDAAEARLHVACAGGELVSLDDGGVEVRRLRIDDDLRDVVIDGGDLWLTRFRSAELLRVPSTGVVAARWDLPGVVAFTPGMFVPTVAWRTVARPGGGVVVAHQQSVALQVPTGPAAYVAQSGCGSIVQSAGAFVDLSTGSPVVAAGLLPGVVLPVDVAISPDGSTAVFVGAGSRTVVQYLIAPPPPGDGCGALVQQDATAVPSDPVAIAIAPDGTIVLQSREPASLWVFGKQEIPLLDAGSRRDTGHELFHQAGNAGLACASCHPEGRDDGRTWDFIDIGLRRTQNLLGGVTATAPFHWDGKLHDMNALVEEVLTGRMVGAVQSPDRVAALGRWMDALPPLASAAPSDPAAVQRGAAIFADPKTSCVSCHAGPHLTTNGFADVGTGQSFQIPSLLGLRWRAPYMHDGCAATIVDRFGACGGANHGAIAHLSADDLYDLVAYLEVL
jgi:mono/diheme cytochrome c family protein/DNA-binding beta-propeller fold protein YncE